MSEQQPSVEDIMAQAQRIQEELQKAQETLEKTTIVGESAAGMVKVTMSGRFITTSIEIDDSLLTQSKEILQDLIVAAFNDAVAKVEQINQDSVASMMGGDEVSLADTIQPRLS